MDHTERQPAVTNPYVARPANLMNPSSIRTSIPGRRSLELVSSAKTIIHIRFGFTSQTRFSVSNCVKNGATLPTANKCDREQNFYFRKISSQ